MWTVTVLSLLEYTGVSARLMDGTRTGLTPLPYQYSGRHISNWKLSIVVTVKLAPGVTGKIQVGAEPGDCAQVSVPACAVPLAAGTSPNAPVVEVTEPLGAALEQAARPMAAATAATASSVTGRETLSRAALRAAPFPCLGWRAWDVSRRVIRPPSMLDNVAQRPPAAWRNIWLKARGSARGLRVSILNSHIKSDR